MRLFAFSERKWSWQCEGDWNLQSEKAAVEIHVRKPVLEIFVVLFTDVFQMSAMKHGAYLLKYLAYLLKEYFTNLSLQGDCCLKANTQGQGSLFVYIWPWVSSHKLKLFLADSKGMTGFRSLKYSEEK